MKAPDYAGAFVVFFCSGSRYYTVWRLEERNLWMDMSIIWYVLYFLVIW